MISKCFSLFCKMFKSNNLLGSIESFCEKFNKYFTGKGVIYADPSEYVYKWPHLLVLGLAIFATILVYFCLRNKSYATKRNWLVAVAWTIAICEIFSRVTKLLYFAELGQLDLVLAIKTIVPIHFCSLMVWILIFSILFNKNSTLTFATLCGLLASTFYLLYPIEGLSASFLHLRAFNSIFTHSLSFVTSVNLLLCKMVKFDIKDMGKTYLLLICMVAYGGIMNIIFPGENYMFMITNPTSLTFGAIPYQVVFAILVAAIVALFYLIPYYCQKRKLQKQAKKSNNA